MAPGSSSVVSRVCTVNEGTQPALAALLVSALSPEIRGLIKRQKIGREATQLMERALKGLWTKAANKGPSN